MRGLTSPSVDPADQVGELHGEQAAVAQLLRQLQSRRVPSPVSTELREQLLQARGEELLPVGRIPSRAGEFGIRYGKEMGHDLFSNAPVGAMMVAAGCRPVTGRVIGAA